MFHKKKRYFFLLLIFFIGLMLFGSKVLTGQEDKPLRYEVDVNALIIPIFAVDAKGKPVYDLKKEEITLLANAKPVDIAEFTAYQVEGEKRVAGEPTESIEDEGGQTSVQSEGSIHFIIFDAISNSQKGLKRARKIARGIINESPSTDAFVILESAPFFGFRYVIGPETDKRRLGRAMKGLVKNESQSYFSPYAYAIEMGGRNVMGGNDLGKAEYRLALLEIAFRKAEADSEVYRKEIKNFLYSLSQMKYALKTITQPKHVFLISGGIPTSSLRREVTRYYKFMGEAAKAINYGGCMLYMVDPIPRTNTSSSHSLKYMARVSGGKYFGGNSLENIISRVKNNTRAYYELAFLPGQSSGDKLQIELKCKRRDITLHTVNYAEKGKPYKEMEALQKKLFALNVVTGGSWSRIVGNVNKIKYKNLKPTKERTNSNVSKRIRVPIPKNLNGNNMDVFVVNLDPKTMKANIGVMNRLVNQNLDIDVPVEEEKKQFVVIIEPIETLCLYNQVK